ncbi:hypothetical protein H1S01_00955 [Heliobacterium chlorum]|uniref:Uncharacterized protein n=1 Tax=Heliobacterium chlorum TaxID=2698 RepID=A0ABR7SWZ2_HELCL|nr:hypothetical protein [Heliobacterium chlorum]MBC9783073.1 hypothetical protein [Heliobacterium chlorum]
MSLAELLREGEEFKYEMLKLKLSDNFFKSKKYLDWIERCIQSLNDQISSEPLAKKFLHLSKKPTQFNDITHDGILYMLRAFCLTERG